MEIIDVIKALAKNYNIKEVIFYKVEPEELCFKFLVKTHSFIFKRVNVDYDLVDRDIARFFELVYRIK